MSTTIKLLYNRNRNMAILIPGLILVILVMIGSKDLPGPYQFPVAISALIVLIVVVGLMTFMYSYEARADNLLILHMAQTMDDPNLWYKESLLQEEEQIQGEEDRFHRVLRLTQPYDFSSIYNGDPRLENCMDIVMQYWGHWTQRRRLHDGYGIRGGVPVYVPGMDDLFVDPLPAQTLKDEDGVVKTFPVFEVIYSVGADQKVARYAMEILWRARRLIAREDKEDGVKLEEALTLEIKNYAERVDRLRKQKSLAMR